MPLPLRTTSPEFMSTTLTEKEVMFKRKEAMMNIDIACFYKQARVFTLKSIRT
jgi:hypothetical protein